MNCGLSKKTCQGASNLYHPLGPLRSVSNRQRCRRLRKHHLKSEYALLQSLSCLFHLVQFVKCTCWQMLNSKGLYRSSGKEKESRLVFTSSTKRKIRHFHVVVVQSRQKSVMHVQGCCFANLNL